MRGGSRDRVGQNAEMSSSSSAEISVIADGINMYRGRVAGLAEPLIGTPQDDLIAALYEAERALRNAHRAMQRAMKLAR
jgi:hypothetical protein